MDHSISDRALKDAALLVEVKVRVRRHADGGYKYYAVQTQSGEFLAYTAHEVVGLIDMYAGGHERIGDFMEAVGN